jgi:hypothetical protein
MNGLRLLTLEEKNALAVLADAVDRCREEDMRTLDGSSCEALNDCSTPIAFAGNTASTPGASKLSTPTLSARSEPLEELSRYITSSYTKRTQSRTEQHQRGPTIRHSATRTCKQCPARETVT